MGSLLFLEWKMWLLTVERSCACLISLYDLCNREGDDGWFLSH